ncbi:MAG: hypothetical protein ACYC5M_14705 [Anaerolineae bacterium]
MAKPRSKLLTHEERSRIDEDLWQNVPGLVPYLIKREGSDTWELFTKPEAGKNKPSSEKPTKQVP